MNIKNTFRGFGGLVLLTATLTLGGVTSGRAETPSSTPIMEKSKNLEPYLYCPSLNGTLTSEIKRLLDYVPNQPSSFNQIYLFQSEENYSDIKVGSLDLQVGSGYFEAFSSDKKSEVYGNLKEIIKGNFFIDLNPNKIDREASLHDEHRLLLRYSKKYGTNRLDDRNKVTSGIMSVNIVNGKIGDVYLERRLIHLSEKDLTRLTKKIETILEDLPQQLTSKCEENHKYVLESLKREEERLKSDNEKIRSIIEN